MSAGIHITEVIWRSGPERIGGGDPILVGGPRIAFIFPKFCGPVGPTWLNILIDKTFLLPHSSLCLARFDPAILRL